MKEAAKRHAELRREMRRTRGLVVRVLALVAFSGGYLAGVMVVALRLPPALVPAVLLAFLGALLLIMRT